MKHFVTGAIMLLALGGCAQSRWEKPNATADSANADLTDCRHLAQQEAFRRVDRLGYAGAPMWGYSPYSDPLWSRGNYERWAATERLELQVRLTSDCMRQKGYARVPVNPS